MRPHHLPRHVNPFDLEPSGSSREYFAYHPDSQNYFASAFPSHLLQEKSFHCNGKIFVDALLIVNKLLE